MVVTFELWNKSFGSVVMDFMLPEYGGVFL